MNMEAIFAAMNTRAVVFIAAKIAFIFTSLSAVQMYDFHIFTVVYSPLHGFIWNQLKLVSSVGRALYLYRRGHGFKSRTGLNFFLGLIFTTAQVVFIAAKIAFIFNIYYVRRI